MANEEHVAILKQGVDVWNEWREENPAIKPDLSKTDLSFVDLSRMDLSFADLSRANLGGVNFRGARLIQTNFSGALLSGGDLTEATVSEANFSYAILRQATLNEVNLRGVSLRYADLSYARLVKADLKEVPLGEADLSYADLSYADFSGANFYEANLSGANFYEANLSEANFSHANLRRANLSRADCTAIKLGFTIFGDVDLSQVKGLETVEHLGPSTIGIDTIYLSGGNIPEVFLRGAGTPDNFIIFMKSLTGKAFDFYSCFISHSSKDKNFVERLYADLQSNGIRCWYAPEDLKIGEPFLLGIDQGIRLHDKLLLVLSEHSVNSGWVQHEVLSAMAKEQGKEPWVLLPIRLDDAVMQTGVSWATMIRESRHIGDFTQWKNHDSYQEAFNRLMRDLKGKK